MDPLEGATQLKALLEREGVRVGCWRIAQRNNASADLYCHVEEVLDEKQLFSFRMKGEVLRLRASHMDERDVNSPEDLEGLTSVLVSKAQSGLAIGRTPTLPPSPLTLGVTYVALQALPVGDADEPVAVGARVRLVECLLIPRESDFELAFLVEAEPARRVVVFGMDPATFPFFDDPVSYLAVSPGDGCVACGRPASDAEDVARLSYRVMGDAHDEYWSKCPCGIHTHTRIRDSITTGEHRTTSGPIQPKRADAAVKTMQGCPDPTNEKCDCDAHRIARGGHPC